MCAIEAGKRGRRVVVLEHNTQVGRKILISGGGRCNFTNLHTKSENFLSANRHFAKSALARYTPRDFVSLVERHGIRYHEKTLGQLFCDGSASQIVDLLETECKAAGVRIETGRAVGSVRRSASFNVVDNRDSWHAESLVIATGGLSVPKMGATPFGYSVAEQFGLRLVERRPGLVPLTFGSDDQAKFGDLAGVSTEVVASAGGRKFREKMLFTHRGLSGPAILQASSYWKAGEAVEIDLIPGVDLAGEMTRRRNRGAVASARPLLAEYIPKRLADRWCELAGVSKPLAMIGDREVSQLSDSLHRWQVAPGGTEGFEKAEVTAGGVDTTSCRRRLWGQRRFRAYTSSARWSTSRGSWAASTSSGPGHREMPLVRSFKRFYLL